MRNLVSAVFMCQATTAQTLLTHYSYCCTCFLPAWHFPRSCLTVAEAAREKSCICSAHIFIPQQRAAPAVFVPADCMESLVYKRGGWLGREQAEVWARGCRAAVLPGQLCSPGPAAAPAPSLPAWTLPPARWASAPRHCGLQLQPCRSCAVAYPTTVHRGA